MAPLPYQTYLERMVGQGHPALADTNNRALRALLSQSGYDPDASPFPGLFGPVFNLASFGSSGGDGDADDTTAFQEMFGAAINGGVCVIPDPVVEYNVLQKLSITCTGRLAIVGLGRSAAKIRNNITGAAADSLFELNVEGAYYTFANLWIIGNNATGASGNGHAISLLDPVGGFFAPQQVMVRDCRIEQHRGTGKDYTGASIPSCGVYAYGGTGIWLDNTVMSTMAMGLRLNAVTKAFVDHGTFDVCDNSCVHIEAGCESIGLSQTILNGSGAGGAKDGLVYITDSEGVGLENCRLKNGNPYLVNVSTDVGGRAVSGLTIKGGTAQQLDVAGGHTAFGLSNATNGCVIEGVAVRFVNTMTDAVGVLAVQIAGGWELTGLRVADNTFGIGDGGTIAAGVRLNVTSNKVVAPVIEGNTFGKHAATTGYTITSGIEVLGNCDAPTIRNNTFVAVANVIITNAIRLVNGTITNTMLENNVYRAFGGTITNEISQSGGVPYIEFGRNGAMRLVSSGGAVGFWEAQKISADPSAPASNFARFYIKDNGSGKGQLAVRFPSGAVQIVATEP